MLATPVASSLEMLQTASVVITLAMTMVTQATLASSGVIMLLVWESRWRSPLFVLCALLLAWLPLLRGVQLGAQLWSSYYLIGKSGLFEQCQQSCEAAARYLCLPSCVVTSDFWTSCIYR